MASLNLNLLQIAIINYLLIQLANYYQKTLVPVYLSNFKRRDYVDNFRGIIFFLYSFILILFSFIIFLVLNELISFDLAFKIWIGFALIITLIYIFWIKSDKNVKNFVLNVKNFGEKGNMYFNSDFYLNRINNNLISLEKSKSTIENLINKSLAQYKEIRTRKKRFSESDMNLKLKNIQILEKVYNQFCFIKNFKQENIDFETFKKILKGSFKEEKSQIHFWPYDGTKLYILLISCFDFTKEEYLNVRYYIVNNLIIPIFRNKSNKKFNYDTFDDLKFEYYSRSKIKL